MRFFIVIFSLLVISCSSKPVVELPISTSSKKALSYYKKAMKSFEVGDEFEKRLFLDSALIHDSNFVLALEFHGSSDPIIRKEYQDKAKILSANVTEAERKIISIRESYRKGDMDQALVDANWLVSNHGDSYQSFVWLGLVQSDRRELEDAILSLKKAIELNPDSYDAYNLLMGHHIAAGTQQMLPEDQRDVELGLEYGDELIRIRSDHGYPYHFKANCYRQIGDFEKAKPLYEKSIEKRKGLSSEGTANLVSGHNYMFSGDYNNARERYTRAINLARTNNGWFQLNYYLTISHIFENNYLGAIDNINKVEKMMIEKEFDDITRLEREANINWQKMVCYAHNQMEDDAFLSMNNVINLNKKRAGLLQNEYISSAIESEEQYLKAWVNILFGNYDQSRENLQTLKSHQEKRNDPTAMHGYYGLLGMVNLMEGNYDLALSNFENGDNTNIYFNYFKGLTLKASRQEENARKIFKELANFNFSSWEIAIIRNLANKQLEKLTI